MKKICFCSMLIFCLSACDNTDNKEKTKIVQPVIDSLSAQKQLKNDIKKYPDSLLLRENLIQFYNDNGDYTAAIKEVNAAISKDSMIARLWNIKAVLNFENADTAGAITSLEHAIKIFPDPGYIASLGESYAQTRNPNALKLADTLLKAGNNKQDKEAYYIKGLYFSYTNDKLKAISFFDKCLAINYTFMDAYREKAIALYDLGKYEPALEVLDKAITLQNNFDEGYYYSGQCLEKLNRIPEAIQSYQNALQLDSGYIEAKEALVRLHAKN